jgi:hypothetical protein
LFPNQFVNIRLLVDTVHNTVIVPTASILRGAQGLFVWVVDQPGNTVEMRTVKTGPAFGDNTAVLSGLDPGEIVVTDGSDRLRDGQRVFLQGDCIPARRAGAGGPAGGQAEAAPKTIFNLWGLLPSKPKPSTDPMASMRCRPGEHPGGHVGDATTNGAGAAAGAPSATAPGAASATSSGAAQGAAAMPAAAMEGPGRPRSGAAATQSGVPAAGGQGSGVSGAASAGGQAAAGAGGQAPGRSGGMSARMQALFGDLNLDPSQQAKVGAIVQANQPKIMAAFQSGDMNAARAARQAMDQQIDAVLRPDQKAKLDQKRAEMRARMQGGGGGPQ